MIEVWLAKNRVLRRYHALNNPVNNIDPYGELTIPGIGWVDVGESAGQSALEYWANKAARADNPFAGGFYNTMGAFTALWTPCTSDATATTLAAGYAANQIFVRNVSSWAHWEHARGPHKYPHLQFGDLRIKVPKALLDFLRKKVRF